MWDVHYNSHLGEDMLSKLHDYVIVFTNFLPRILHDHLPNTILV